VLIVDEAQNLSDENLEALRLLLNYHVPQRKLLNILLFGQSELEACIHAKGNLADRVDGWIRLDRLDEAMSSAVLDFRLARAGYTPETPLFTADGRRLLIEAAEGLPRRLTMLAHVAMEEAADRASTLVTEDHVRAAMHALGITARPMTPLVLAETTTLSTNGSVVETSRGLIARFFARRPPR
jgi:MSHA biogenesis protein MshM